MGDKKIPFWKRRYPGESGNGTFGDYDYTPELKTVLLWILFFILVGCWLASLVHGEDLSPLSVNI